MLVSLMRRGLVLLALLVGCQSAPTSPTPAPAKPIATAAITPSAPKPAASPTAPSAPSPSPGAVGSPSPKPTTPPSPVAGTPVPVTATRLEILNSANAALAGGDATAAALLYERVVNTPPSADEQVAVTTAINDFARFRAIAAWLAAGQEQDAEEHLDALLSRDVNAPLTRLAQQLWDQYTMTANARAACAQIQSEVTTQAAGVVQTLRGLGVEVDPATFCGIR